MTKLIKFYQDNFYFKKESNFFFERNISKILREGMIRKNKIQILEFIKKYIKINKNSEILEIGCFIGDLLFLIKKKYKSKVYGVEPSKLACSYANDKYNLKIENKTFLNSTFFPNTKKNFQKFDLIIIDDVLSWIDRDILLNVIASIDWALKDNGHIFLRDFSPKNSFAVKNHHWKSEKIYNFKVKNGHKTFFLESGKYKIIKSKIFYTEKFNNKKSLNKQSNIWNEVILKKSKKFTYPINRF
tara:strand:+ start:1636 stop:2364 length:729 start_codon:yes stop_codon:yes gene_type:complete